ncbi:glycosyltransferase [Heyndrickxia oleronia]|jgi:rhamnosyltransferase|uniref:glycosyltransferase n=1 Tax=Heyndrickxia oleronia TaxID=38875 RepID=UPI00242C31EE|nr:glycosyltransferase [Heyndrickxia oleronia]MCI1593403.1 glycosyltransferase [Heyndrickxia oleronia]MCI1746501.1 glycosyltransferase [Heyndrickxia oleronia]MCI1764296.1 glycosyltransferase [Heyndrickxia oleronia]
MDICAVIVTYNPSIEMLTKNIQATKAQVSNCLLVDNGSSNNTDIVNFADSNNVKLISLKKNKGIAAAQNVGFNWAKNNVFDWVLTLDQDSIIPKNMMEEYMASGKMLETNTGIITGTYFDRKWTQVQKRHLSYQGNDSFSEKKMVISSGNLVKVSAWEKVSGFDESLFIDMVDYDFDAKLVLAGYKIWQINRVKMEHAVGKVIHKPVLEHLLLLPETGLLADHPSFRQYYIYRNTIIFQKRYPMFGEKKFLIIRSILATRRMIVYRNSFPKFIAAWKGIRDGNRYNPNNDVFFKNIMKQIHESSKIG